MTWADNLPGGLPLSDTSALEVVLHHAGLALDRAVLERALAEIESERGSAESLDGSAPGTREGDGSPAVSSRNAQEDR